MMHNMVHPQEILPAIASTQGDDIYHADTPFQEGISSPLGAQFEFSESDLFPETLQNSEFASISSNNCCHEEHSSYNPTNNLSITMDDMNNYDNTLDNDATNVPPSTGINDQPIFFEDDVLSASIDFTPSPSFSLPNHLQYFNNDNNNNQEVIFSIPSSFNSNMHMSLGDDVMHPYTAFDHPYDPEWRQVVADPPPKEAQVTVIPTGGFMSPSYDIWLMSSIDPMNIGSHFPSSCCRSFSTAPFSLDSSGINFEAGTFGSFLGNDHHSVQHREMELQGDDIDGGFFHPDSIARVFNCSTGDLQAVGSESQHLLIHGSPSTTLASEISNLDDPNFKVGKLSVEERKMKIHRYMKKRNERNFSKKIKREYACRKTLADSRPRVRGRFAKNDELAEIARITSTRNSYGADDTDEDVTLFSNPNIHDHQLK
ncbi:hypothetical protein OROHE_003031 [Orobanche hederae]